MAHDTHITTDSVRPTTVEGFLADRQHFWLRFTRFIIGVVIIVALVLIGLVQLTYGGQGPEPAPVRSGLSR